MKELFRDVCPVVNIPFRVDETICYEELNRIIAFCLQSGCESLCLFAFNSEPHKLTTDEKKSVIRYFLEKTARRVQTLIGLIDNSIAGVIELGISAKEHGADGVILYPPSISCPTGAELAGFFKTAAYAIGLPVMIQDNPRSTGVQMSTEFLLQLYQELPLFRFLKVECPSPTRKIRELVQATNGELKCYSGNGGIFAIQAHQCGAWGLMPGVAVCGQFVELCRALRAGETERARARFEKLLPLVWYEDQSLEFYIACEKALLKQNGILSTDVARHPCALLSAEEREELFQLYIRAVR